MPALLKIRETTSPEKQDTKSTKPKTKWQNILSVKVKSTKLLPLVSDLDLSPENTPLYSSPTAEPSELLRKYGKPGHVIATGAGGVIQLIVRDSDALTFAVKCFKERQTKEEEDSEYIRKILREFEIGRHLRHENTIQTFDLFNKGKRFYAVMEYAPYCLLDIVLSREMSEEQKNCSFAQIVAGVDYLHRCGFAHRDLKLENVVVNEKGVMKIIDFGSAVVCRHPVTKVITLATGIVGCHPYMAPEIFKYHYYDAQKIDIWSLAIVYCCMVLGRFPWMIATMSDDSYRLFAARQGPIQQSKGNTEQTSSEPPPSRTSYWTSQQKSAVKANKAEPISGCNINQENFPHLNDVGLVQGPERLLRSLPIESRKTIANMLSLSASGRPSLTQICEEAWIRECQRFPV